MPPSLSQDIPAFEPRLRDNRMQDSLFPPPAGMEVIQDSSVLH